MELLAPKAKTRRDNLREQRKCINGPTHAAPVPGRDKCPWCVQVHRKGATRALELARESADNPQPPPGWRGLYNRRPWSWQNASAEQ